MTKQELIDKLRALGYQAEIIEGIPYIFNVPYSKADKVIKELGYIGSYGVKKEAVCLLMN